MIVGQGPSCDRDLIRTKRLELDRVSTPKCGFFNKSESEVELSVVIYPCFSNHVAGKTTTDGSITDLNVFHSPVLSHSICISPMLALDSRV